METSALRRFWESVRDVIEWADDPEERDASPAPPSPAGVASRRAA